MKSARINLKNPVFGLARAFGGNKFMFPKAGEKLAVLFLFLMVFTLILGCVQSESPKEENKTTEVTVDNGSILVVETNEPEIKENEDLPPPFPE